MWTTPFDTASDGGSPKNESAESYGLNHKNNGRYSCTGPSFVDFPFAAIFVHHCCRKCPLFTVSLFVVRARFFKCLFVCFFVCLVLFMMKAFTRKRVIKINCTTLFHELYFSDFVVHRYYPQCSFL